MPNIEIKTTLSKLLIRQKPLKSDFEHFCGCIATLLHDTKSNESEEYNKNLLAKFLLDSFYKNNAINTKHRIDLAIYSSDTSEVVVIIETKSPNNRAEFPSVDNINSKALQETLLYFLRERILYSNLEIKHIIITNNYEWFVFDAVDFDRLFAQNKELVKRFRGFEEYGNLSNEKTCVFYSDIAQPAIELVKDNLPFVYFDLRKKRTNSEMADIFKLFSPSHLLKLNYFNDSNTLNTAFYNELLHIIGLEEKDDGGKKIICRKDISSRDSASLLESTIYQLGDYISNKDKQFDIALNLTITWINRVLFLKLLESQLISYHPGNGDKYRFLNIKVITDFDNLNELFFKVLAKTTDDREQQVKERYGNVPYLNSSLFDLTENESKYFRISGLISTKLIISKQTVLKDANGTKLSGSLDTLEYLFRFLDAYDFGSESAGEELTRAESKTLINASVLGLIFEKINGYKDGSFFTPGVITQYMCKETLQRSVIQKFNEIKGWSCVDMDSLYNHIENRTEANAIVNSIKICDPAVGSGHFLVSALNTLIAIKNDLKILQDKDGRRLKEYSVVVENDELMVHDENGEPFVYNPKSKESQRVQETLFYEKRTIIESCLFGVDINSNSVNICRLRLWIELLKNAYYIDGTDNLQTLPNIDINIKCGNSLVSRFALNADLGQALRRSRWNISSYKSAIQSYHDAHSKDEKRELERLIESIKGDFQTEISINDTKTKRLKKANDELDTLLATTLFELTEKEKTVWKKKTDLLSSEIARLKTQMEEIKSNKIYENALEWRFEFPEVLDDEGNFVGFDCVIGNPPYIQLQNNAGELAKQLEKLNYQTFARTGDIYCCFYERGWQLLRDKSHLCFITSNKWMRSAYGEVTRRFFASSTNPILLIDFSGSKIFESATVDTNILLFSKEKNRGNTICSVTKNNNKECFKDLSDFVKQNHSFTDFGAVGSDSWVILSEIEQSIKRKIESVGTPLKDWDISIYRGILTGCNDAFIISTEKKNEIIAKCLSEEEKHRTDELIRPILRGRDIKRYGYDWANLWLINTHNGIRGKIPRVDINEYPAVKAHLDQHWEQIRDRADQGDTPYNLRNCAYLEDFSKPKIVWKRVGSILRFCYSDNAVLGLDSTCFATGINIEFVCCVLNSPMGHYLLKDAPKTGTGDLLISVQAVNPIKIPIIRNGINSYFEKLLKLLIDGKNTDIENKLSHKVFDLYGLSTDERLYIIENFS